MAKSLSQHGRRGMAEKDTNVLLVFCFARKSMTRVTSSDQQMSYSWPLFSCGLLTMSRNQPGLL